jgi:hypothetical protein
MTRVTIACPGVKGLTEEQAREYAPNSNPQINAEVFYALHARSEHEVKINLDANTNNEDDFNVVFDSEGHYYCIDCATILSIRIQYRKIIPSEIFKTLAIDSCSRTQHKLLPETTLSQKTHGQDCFNYLFISLQNTWRSLEPVYQLAVVQTRDRIAQVKFNGRDIPIADIFAAMDAQFRQEKGDDQNAASQLASQIVRREKLIISSNHLEESNTDSTLVKTLEGVGADNGESSTDGPMTTNEVRRQATLRRQRQRQPPPPQDSSPLTSPHNSPSPSQNVNESAITAETASNEVVNDRRHAWQELINFHKNKPFIITPQLGSFSYSVSFIENGYVSSAAACYQPPTNYAPAIGQGSGIPMPETADTAMTTHCNVNPVPFLNYLKGLPELAEANRSRNSSVNSGSSAQPFSSSVNKPTPTDSRSESPANKSRNSSISSASSAQPFSSSVNKPTPTDSRSESPANKSRNSSISSDSSNQPFGLYTDASLLADNSRRPSQGGGGGADDSDIQAAPAPSQPAKAQIQEYTNVSKTGEPIPQKSSGSWFRTNQASKLKDDEQIPLLSKSDQQRTLVDIPNGYGYYLVAHNNENGPDTDKRNRLGHNIYYPEHLSLTAYTITHKTGNDSTFAFTGFAFTGSGYRLHGEEHDQNTIEQFLANPTNFLNRREHGIWIAPLCCQGLSKRTKIIIWILIILLLIGLILFLLWHFKIITLIPTTPGVPGFCAAEQPVKLGGFSELCQNVGGYIVNNLDVSEPVKQAFGNWLPGGFNTMGSSAFANHGCPNMPDMFAFAETTCSPFPAPHDQQIPGFAELVVYAVKQLQASGLVPQGVINSLTTLQRIIYSVYQYMQFGAANYGPGQIMQLMEIFRINPTDAAVESMLVNAIRTITEFMTNGVFPGVGALQQQLLEVVVH